MLQAPEQRFPCRATCSWLPGTMSRWLLSISKVGDSTTSLGNLCQCSVTFTVKKHFLTFRGNLLCFSLSPSPLVLGTTEKSLDLSSSHPPLQVFINIDEMPLSLHFSRLQRTSSLSLHSCERCSSLFIIIVALR